MIAIAHCPSNGYVHARSKTQVKGKTIWRQHWECYHHFVCRAVKHFSPAPSTSHVLQAHWEGTTDRNAVDMAVAEMFRRDRLQVIAVHAFDGRFVDRCYYCNTIPRKPGRVSTYGKIPRKNGPTVL